MLNKDFREFFECLNSRNVRYLLIGGYAVAFHGHPRYTKDIDVWFDRTEANVANVLLALQDFGFGDLDLREADLMEPDSVIQIGYPPNRIDLLNSPDGVEFGECFEQKIVFELDGLKIPVIDLGSLRRNKKASGRLQDLADLEELAE